MTSQSLNVAAVNERRHSRSFLPAKAAVQDNIQLISVDQILQCKIRDNYALHLLFQGAILVRL